LSLKKTDMENIVTDKESDVEDIVEDDPEKILRCANCDFESELPRVLKRHFNSLIECSECSKLFCGRYAKRKYESHQKEHKVKQKKLPFMCVHCHKQFNYKSNLKNHLLWSKCGRATPPKTIQMDQNGVVTSREMSDSEVKSFQMVKDDNGSMSVQGILVPEKIVTEEESDIKDIVKDEESVIEDIITKNESDILNIKEEHIEVSCPSVIEEELEEGIFKCSNCDFKTSRHGSMAQHKSSARVCTVCSKIFCGKYAKGQHESHQKKHNAKKKIPFMCVHCNKQFPNKSRLKQHLVRSACGRKTPPKTILKDQSGEYRQMSDLEVESFQSTQPVQTIKTNVSEEESDVENTVTDKESDMENIAIEKEFDILNFKEVHLEVSCPSVIEEETDEGIIKCSNCDFKTTVPLSMTKHKSSIRVCTVCSKVFCGKHAKRQHESHQKKHKKIRKIPFMCVHCNKQFPTKSSLKKHLVWSACGRKTPPKTILKDQNGEFRQMSDLEVESFQSTHPVQPAQTSAVFISKPDEDKVDVKEELICEVDPLVVGLEERLRYAHSIRHQK